MWRECYMTCFVFFSCQALSLLHTIEIPAKSHCVDRHIEIWQNESRSQPIIVASPAQSLHVVLLRLRDVADGGGLRDSRQVVTAGSRGSGQSSGKQITVGANHWWGIRHRVSSEGHGPFPLQRLLLEILPLQLSPRTDIFHRMKSAEFGIACVDRVRRNLRRLSGDPMPVNAFVQPKAFLVTILVCAPDALVDEGSICSHLGRAVLVAVPVLPDLEKSNKLSHVFRFA